MYEFYLRVRPDGTCETPGIDFGGPDKVNLWDAKFDLNKSLSVIVLKIDGGMHWASRGTQRYHAAEFYVCKVLEKSETGTLKVQTVIDFEIRNRNLKMLEYFSKGEQ